MSSTLMQVKHFIQIFYDDVIMVVLGFYGYENPMGTLDIYVNGGQRIQPGCLDEFNTPSSFGDILEKCNSTLSTTTLSLNFLLVRMISQLPDFHILQPFVVTQDPRNIS